MSSNGYPLTPPSSEPSAADRAYFEIPRERTRPRHRYWLHALLLAATLLTTTVVGAELAHSFAANRAFDFDADLAGYLRFWHDPAYLLPGLAFSLTLLTILLAHEFGHYIAARYYDVDATLPFFIPAPTLIGTLGAFIRIRSVILSKRILFDIGIAGPLAGFAVLIWPLAVGISFSKVVPGVEAHSQLIFGTPLIMRLMEMIQFPGVPARDICVNPVARAAWVGLLATALNLLPIGQLDGGHILYSFLGEKTKYLSRTFIAALIPMGIFFTYRWLFWAGLLLLFGMRHPAIVDPAPVGRTRSWLGIVALAVFVLSFTVVPVRTNVP
ncbi:MAG TPA: site-2 protease family protein [Bryobacteraceae bacterium]|nr:site-2 protease family protein [Bryobacteraceae bacterium]